MTCEQYFLAVTCLLSVHVYAGGGHRFMLGVFLTCAPHFLRESLIDLEFLSLARLASQQIPGNACCHA